MPPPDTHPLPVKYRPDIDGLRAVAVFLVLLYHLGTHVYGGYVGVDVFFVISGYLIGAVILNDMRAGRFSIVNFYERRIRRIFPALLVMMALTTALTLFFFIPQEIEAYGRSALAALFSVSNILFWKQSGYFDAPSLVKPLLHTWSLGVEEQFYIFFPLALAFIRRFAPSRMRAILFTLTILSFFTAAIVVYRDPATAFFLAPLRAWELLLGTLLSQKYFPRIQSALARNLASAAGLLAILYAGHWFTERTSFPGLTALVPCIGAALVIAAGEEGPSLVGKALSWKPIVFLGLISYSLYLWHWPLLVFQETGSMLFPNAAMTGIQKLLFVFIAVAIASLSWAFVEQPFRKGRFRPGRRAVFLVNGSAVALVAAASLALLYFHGFPGRFPPEAQKIAAYADFDRAPSTREGVCFLSGRALLKDLQQDTCLARRPGRKSVLLLGDSHAAQLYPGLQSVFPDRDILQVNAPNCPPLVPGPNDRASKCRDVNTFVFDHYLPAHPVDLVILSARWQPEDVAGITQTVDHLQATHIPVLLVGPSLEYDQGMPRMLAIALKNSTVQQIQDHRLSAPQQLDQRMAALAAARWHVPYVSIYKSLCTPACPLYGAHGVPLLFDSNHFTPEASALLAEKMKSNHELE